MLGGQAEGPADPAHGGAAHEQALDLAQFLRGVTVVELLVGGAEQRGHLGADVGGQLAGRRLAAALVHQASGARGPVAALKPLELPEAQVQGGGALGIAHMAGQGRLQQARPPDFLAAHRQGLPCLHGVTFSLTS
jgi:hypothetical protein